MKKMNWRRRLKYLKAVADHLVECGYIVEQPKHDDDYLDVWGTYNGTRCFEEIYVTMYECDNGINGIWHYGEHEGTEMFLSNEKDYGLDTRWGIEGYLSSDNLKPFKRGRIIKGVP